MYYWSSVSITTADGIGFNKILERHTTAFCGQLGRIYLFDDVMFAEQTKGVFNLGLEYIYSFLSSEDSYVPENISTDGIINDKDELAFKMVFGYNAQVRTPIFSILIILEYFWSLGLFFQLEFFSNI